jgi:hypothetical protein
MEKARALTGGWAGWQEASAGQAIDEVKTTRPVVTCSAKRTATALPVLGFTTLFRVTAGSLLDQLRAIPR